MAPGGYAWWYVDALSDDGDSGLTLIAFIGSVFSPYYAWQRRRAAGGAADATDHCAINIALYGRGGKRWAMTERGRAALARDATTLRVGPSSLVWRDGALEAEIDEVTVPIPSRVRGRFRVEPLAVMTQPYALDAGGVHHWQPIAPCARIEVEFERPHRVWRGHAYVDHNRGDAPLERHFVRWDWSRATLGGGDAAVLYDVTRRDGTPLSLALRFDAAGRVSGFSPPPPAALPTTGWRIVRGTRSDAGHPARVHHTLEDTPFYARSLVGMQLNGEPATAVHESLSLDRFTAPIVQAMLPFRMPRRAR